MATNTNIKDAYSFPADETNAFISDGRTVGNAELARCVAWMNAVYANQLFDSEGEPRSADANDLAAWSWGQLAGQVKGYEKSLLVNAALAAVDEVDELTEVV